MTVGAYKFKTENDLDNFEEYTKLRQCCYTIPYALMAVISIENYKYKISTNVDSNGTVSGEFDTNSSFTTKVSF